MGFPLLHHAPQVEEGTPADQHAAGGAWLWPCISILPGALSESKPRAADEEAGRGEEARTQCKLRQAYLF